MSLGKVCSYVRNPHVTVERSAPGTFRPGMLLQFRCYGTARAGTAEVLGVEEYDDVCVLKFARPLYTLVPAIAEGDDVEEYVPPCQRCRCAECERLHGALLALLARPEEPSTCPARDSNGVRCELPSGHDGEHACPEALANWLGAGWR